MVKAVRAPTPCIVPKRHEHACRALPKRYCPLASEPLTSFDVAQLGLHAWAEKGGKQGKGGFQGQSPREQGCFRDLNF